MEADDNRLPSNSTVFTDRRKQKIGNNAQQREKATFKAVAKANLTIGNAPQSTSPTVPQFERSSRLDWKRIICINRNNIFFVLILKTLALNYLPRRSPSKYCRRFITFHN